MTRNKRPADARPAPTSRLARSAAQSANRCEVSKRSKNAIKHQSCHLVARNLYRRVLGGRLGEIGRIGVGFGAAGAGLVLLVTARSRGLVFTFVGLLALGMALISPNLSALISKRGGRRHVGGALGAQNAANSLGQASGTLLGSALLLWQGNKPYLMTGTLLVVVSVVIGWTAHAREGFIGRKAAARKGDA